MEHKESATFNVAGREYPISDYVETKEFGTLPIVDIPMMTNYKWQKLCLEFRIKNRELYGKHEDVDTSIAELQAWIAKNEPEKK